MGLLPDIIEGKLDLDSEQKKELKKYHNSMIPLEKRKKLAEHIGRLKARQAVKDAENADKNLGELNNEGHAEITADFSDSPFADRAEEAPEEEEESTQDDD